MYVSANLKQYYKCILYWELWLTAWTGVFTALCRDSFLPNQACNVLLLADMDKQRQKSLVQSLKELTLGSELMSHKSL